jgi:SnoaL-like domain
MEATSISPRISRLTGLPEAPCLDVGPRRRDERRIDVATGSAAEDQIVFQSAVRDLVDQAAIRQVIVNFCRGWDRLDKELVLSCYHPGATDNHGIFRGEPSEFYDAWASPDGLRSNNHHLGQSNIRVDGETAVAETHCIATSVADGDDVPQARVHVVRYLDRFEKRGGAWKIAERFVAFDAELQSSGGIPTVPSEENLGRLGNQDRSVALFAALAS